MFKGLVLVIHHLFKSSNSVETHLKFNIQNEKSIMLIKKCLINYRYKIKHAILYDKFMVSTIETPQDIGLGKLITKLD
jgi:hypothetical protein